MDGDHHVTCQVCKRQLRAAHCIPSSLVRSSLVVYAPTTWDATGFICHQDLNRLRSAHIDAMLTQGSSPFKTGAIDLNMTQIITTTLLEETSSVEYTFGQRVSDNVAKFGGSWRFLISFFLFLVIWIVANTTLAVMAWDPAPFILLNLILSCLAAVQAPIIMMSANRQEARDRLRDENDYKVNLKSEMEIRHLNEKFDHLMEHQWQQLMEVQRNQLEILQDSHAIRHALPRSQTIPRRDSIASE